MERGETIKSSNEAGLDIHDEEKNAASKVSVLQNRRGDRNDVSNPLLFWMTDEEDIRPLSSDDLLKERAYPDESSKESVSDVRDENQNHPASTFGVSKNYSTDPDASPSPSTRKLLWSALVKTFSAGLYIFDFVTNILVAVKYYRFNYVEEDLKHVIPGAFIAYVILLSLGHVGSAIALMLELPPEEKPLRSAYFLPLLQFERLLVGLWRSAGDRAMHQEKPQSTTLAPRFRCTCQVEALYAITSASMEAAPSFFFQLVIYVYVGYLPDLQTRNNVLSEKDVLRHDLKHAIFLLSLVISALSAVYNSGRSIMFQSSLQWSATLNVLGIAGGVFNLSALLIRAATLVNVAVFAILLGNIPFAVWYFQNVLIVSFIIYCLVLQLPDRWQSRSLSWRVIITIMTNMVSTYVTASFGPLYALVSDANKRRGFKNDRFHRRLLLMVALHLLWEILFVVTPTLTIIHLSDSDMVLQISYFCRASFGDPNSARTWDPVCWILVTFFPVDVVMEILATAAFLCLLTRSKPTHDGTGERCCCYRIRPSNKAAEAGHDVTNSHHIRSDLSSGEATSFYPTNTNGSFGSFSSQQ